MTMETKTCQNCARATSYRTDVLSPCYCFAFDKYVSPIGCCQLYIPNNGYETDGEGKEE